MNFHDEQYLPFEGAGAISSWRLDLDVKSNPDFSLEKIVLILKYTARDGGGELKTDAKG